MKIENVKSFIRYGVNEQYNRDKTILGGLGISALAFLAGTCGFGQTNTIWLAIVIYVLSIVHMLLLFKVSKNINSKKYLLCSTIFCTFSTTVFSLSSAIFLIRAENPYVVLICLIPGGAALISFLFVFIQLNRNKYLNKKNNPKYKNIGAFVMIGMGCTYFARDYLFDWTSYMSLSEDTYSAILQILLASVFALMATPTALKFYYACKLDSLKK